MTTRMTSSPVLSSTWQHKAYAPTAQTPPHTTYGSVSMRAREQ
jgi:hypothetical protein